MRNTYWKMLSCCVTIPLAVDVIKQTDLFLLFIYKCCNNQLTTKSRFLQAHIICLLCSSVSSTTLFLFQAFSSIIAVGFTRQHHQNAQVTKRTAGVTVKMSGQENADRSYMSLLQTKWSFFCKTVTLPLKLIYFSIRVTRPHNRDNKITSFYTEAVGYLIWNCNFLGFPCTFQQNT